MSVCMGKLGGCCWLGKPVCWQFLAMSALAAVVIPLLQKAMEGQDSHGMTAGQRENREEIVSSYFIFMAAC